ncbi:uncharacterized protein LACBIDRAFT_331007 [Laccaria bicolor S238N-H82]|uniref:Predicted protein n=1 Tax=Laccaria bicolor (strain S238N-H82 / ATCC MYA-4686) TaxID=486041 RepID=B0DMY6_LACBS|nr:uncharacterized protein LACBIDRAFT_331007 [Laccaria bicolor S238N-H82]EDR04130.1 predicted protein [Laccaria bicolor S238N-H82]|eukprot:XP_001885385.1 predicted protein [Laccaria bicolor S238N-H82]
MEVAGFVIGAVSMASLLSTCMQGYAALLSAQNLGKDASKLLCQLEIEEARLMMWGRSVGLLSPSNSDGKTSGCTIALENAQTVMQILVQISSITNDAKELKKRYGLDVELSGTNDNVGSRSYIQGLRSLREQYSREQERQSSLTSTVQSRSSLFQKIPWVSVDKETFSDLVTRLRGYNDTLLGMLESASRLQFQNDFRALCLEASAMKDMLKLQVIQGAAGNQYKEIALPAGHKILRLKLEMEYTQRFEARSNGSSSQGGTIRDSLQLPNHKVHVLEIGAPRSLGMYRNQQVMVEWRSFGDSVTSVNDELLQRLQNLTRLLHHTTPKPDEFRVLSSHGFLTEEQPARFAFIFQPPSLSNCTLITKFPDSLNDLLSDDNPRRYRPSQTSRFLLARRLATSLLHLHSTDWLHKGIRSHNILLFGPGDRSSSLSISKLIEEPFIVGFGFARLSSAYDATEPVDNDPIYAQYRHPDVQGEERESFSKKYDVYSLGLILIEIAYWKPLRKLVSENRNASENLKRLKRDVLESGDLAHWMGDVYKRTVEVCLSSCSKSAKMLWSRFVSLLRFRVVPHSASTFFNTFNSVSTSCTTPRPFFSVSQILACFSRSIFTALSFPHMAAQCNGVPPKNSSLHSKNFSA